MTTLNLIVGAGADNGFLEGSGSFTANSATYGLVGGVGWNSSGQHDNAWVRFTGVTIGNSATINTCVLTGNARSGSTSTVTLLISCDAADNSSAPTNAADYNGRTGTTGTSWSIGSVTSGVDHSTPDVAAELQSIVNRAGWASGNAVMFLIKDNGSSQFKSGYWKTYASSTSLCARAAIDYTAGGGGGGGLPYFFQQGILHGGFARKTGNMLAKLWRGLVPDIAYRRRAA